MTLEQLAFFASVLVDLEVALVTLAVARTFTGSIRCQNCFFQKLSWTLRRLEFKIIMVARHYSLIYLLQLKFENHNHASKVKT